MMLKEKKHPAYSTKWSLLVLINRSWPKQAETSCVPEVNVLRWLILMWMLCAVICLGMKLISEKTGYHGVRLHESVKVKPPDHQSDYSPSVKLQRVGYWHQESEMMSARPATNRKCLRPLFVTICWCWEWGLVGGFTCKPSLQHQLGRLQI